MKRLEALEELSQLSSTQWGLVTARQAQELGVGGYDLTRLAEAGLLERIRQGVYAVTSAPLDQAQEVRAEWLALSPGKPAGNRLGDPEDAVVSHRAAATLHGIGDLDAAGVDFTVPSRRQTRQPGVRFHRGVVPAADRTDVEGLPVTTVLRTLEDLVREGHDGGHLLDMVTDALTARSVVLGEVVERLAPYASVFGVPAGDTEQLGEVFLAAAPAANPLNQAGEILVSQWMHDVLAPIWHNAEFSRFVAQALVEMTESRWRPEWASAIAEALRPSIPSAGMSEVARSAWSAQMARPIIVPPEITRGIWSTAGSATGGVSDTDERRENQHDNPGSTDEDPAEDPNDRAEEPDAQDPAAEPPLDQGPVGQPGPGRRPQSG